MVSEIERGGREIDHGLGMCSLAVLVVMGIGVAFTLMIKKIILWGTGRRWR